VLGKPEQPAHGIKEGEESKGPQLQNLIKVQQKSARCQQVEQAGETRQAPEGLASLLPACNKADSREKNQLFLSLK